VTALSSGSRLRRRRPGSFRGCGATWKGSGWRVVRLLRRLPLACLGEQSFSDLEAAANLHPHDRGASNLCRHAGGYSQVRFGNPPHRSNDLVLGNPGQERLKDDLRLQPPRSWRLDLLRPDHLSELARTAPTRIAEKLGCHPKTVRRRLHRFNADGMDGLGDRPGAGRKPRITEDERSRIMTLVSKNPPGRLLRATMDRRRRLLTIRRLPTGPWMRSPIPPKR
jgi:hypothetical protein